MVSAGRAIALLAVIGMSGSVGAAQVDKAYVRGVTGFGFKALNELARTNPDKNVFISPTSLSMALAMTYNGSSGSTRTAMQKALGIAGFDPKKASSASFGLIQSLTKAEAGVELNIANSLWARKGIKFKPDFLKTNKQYFKAEVKQVTFGPAAVKAVNSWVKAKTGGKIPEIISQMPANAILYLINAVYFKGAWTNTFDKERTSDGPFTLADGDKLAVPMMRRNGSYSYYKGTGFQGISLPYGQGRMRMYVFLPDKASAVPDLVHELTAQKWETWTRGFNATQVDLCMPRFKIEYKAEDEMKAALKTMGMAVAFDPAKADFSRMAQLSGNRVYISQVVHKTFLDVNEAGTEAAAATSIGMAFTSAPMRPIEMVVDHPFLCAIADGETGAVLFVGAVMNPKA